MKNKLWTLAIAMVLFSAFLFTACAPLREFGHAPAYQGAHKFAYTAPKYDPSKPTVVVVASNDGTELFDMMAPFYLFNATGKTNVFLVAKEKRPIVVKKGLFVLPQHTFQELDDLKIRPDVIVIPFLAVADSLHQDPVIVSWIKDHYSDQVHILSVCDGAATAAATGLFDGKPITAHASDYAGIKRNFQRPLWVQETSVAHQGNLYSTAGVSNATEGSLLLIQKLFGEATLQQVIADVSYPHSAPKLEHQSRTFAFGDKVSVGKKLLFRKNRKVGIWLQDGINEFELAGILDTYNRTFPKSIESFSDDNRPVRSCFGLTLIPTGQLNSGSLDELHILQSNNTSYQSYFKGAEIVAYDSVDQQYIIEHCLSRIGSEYGGRFQHVVKLMLDYN